MSATNPRISRDEYSSRLERFATSLKPNSVAIIVSNPERQRSNDTEHQYRQSSDVLYLNGFPEPEAALVVTNFKGKVERIMFVREKIRAREIWTGIRLGEQGAKTSYLADKAFINDKFGEVVGKLIARADHVYYAFGHNEDFDKKFRALWLSHQQRPLFNPEDIIHEMRLFKSDEELAVMARAAQISAEAHCEAMRLTRPGMFEYQVQAALEAVLKFNGCESPSYTSIVGGGNNAVILHYITNKDVLADGQIVLIDAAGELEGYAADITRAFPVSGKFTPAQREIYDLVLAAQLASIKAAVAGSTLEKVHDAGARVLRRGLVKLGILPAEMGTKTGERKALKAYAREHAAAKKAGKPLPRAPLTLLSFFMHGTSHWLGLDVHDVATNGTRSDKGKKRKLEPGMVFTVEPGLYFDKKDRRVAARFRGIGIRIEDDVAITTGGTVILSAGVPKDADEIERLMAEGRSHCQFVAQLAR